jgi:hypothetical protein
MPGRARREADKRTSATTILSTRLHLIVDSVIERLRPTQKREAMLATGAVFEDAQNLLRLIAGLKEDVETPQGGRAPGTDYRSFRLPGIPQGRSIRAPRSRKSGIRFQGPSPIATRFPVQAFDRQLGRRPR